MFFNKRFNDYYCGPHPSGIMQSMVLNGRACIGYFGYQVYSGHGYTVTIWIQWSDMPGPSWSLYTIIMRVSIWPVRSARSLGYLAGPLSMLLIF